MPQDWIGGRNALEEKTIDLDLSLDDVQHPHHQGVTEFRSFCFSLIRRKTRYRVLSCSLFFVLLLHGRPCGMASGRLAPHHRGAAGHAPLFPQWVSRFFLFFFCFFFGRLDLSFRAGDLGTNVSRSFESRIERRTCQCVTWSRISCTFLLRSLDLYGMDCATLVIDLWLAPERLRFGPSPSVDVIEGQWERRF